jgi:hypothetical protein
MSEEINGEEPLGECEIAAECLIASGVAEQSDDFPGVCIAEW